MVRVLVPHGHSVLDLSVLALSSRFDGPVQLLVVLHIITNFQYSLCRVVLMVRRRIAVI